jgi:hypothetical protein
MSLIHQPSYRSSGKRLTTTATLCCIRVAKLEASANQSIAVIQNHPIDIQNALGVANHLETIVIVDFIFVTDRVRLDEVHHIRHARTAALTNANPQAQIFALLFTERFDLLQRGFGHLDTALLRLSCLCHHVTPDRYLVYFTKSQKNPPIHQPSRRGLTFDRFGEISLSDMQ